ncbi:membrane-associated protein, putative [Bodo saltans]|uniref:Membrane-associated protein, putative n=1 Tax=Bodo saltans TaxID=75058 RepID=A0A0S4JL04_BODSA|nr:membrane-associated protein, putative [Bodo saltans]|eukprot:CUG92194.1 membrane-associated protein, putative [Bodo saltans]
MWKASAFVVLLSVVVLAQFAASSYIPLTFTAAFESTDAFCVFVENQYTNSRKPIGVLSRNITLPLCFGGIIQGWITVEPTTTTPNPTTTTIMPTTTTTSTAPSSTTSVTNAPSSVNTTTSSPAVSDAPTSTEANSTTTLNSTTSFPTTTSLVDTTTTSSPASSTTAPVVAQRNFDAMDVNESSTTTTTAPSTTTASTATTSSDLPSSSTNASGITTSTSVPNTTSAPASTSNGTTTTTTTTAAPSTPIPTPAPTAAVAVWVSFVMTGSPADDTIARENWVLSLSDATLQSLFGIASLTFAQVPSPQPSTQISVSDPRANTTSLPAATDVFFLLRLTSYYRYRLPGSWQFLPWRLNDPSAGTIWASIGTILLGLNATNANIDFTASWFPISWTSPQGSINTVNAFNEDEMYSQGMFPCNQAYLDTPDPEDAGDGFNCWFSLAPDATGLSTISSAQVMALLNSAPIRAQIAASIGGGVSLDMVPKISYSRAIVDFDTIKTKAQDDYTTKKSYFAAGMVVWLVVVVAALTGLWVWTGSGRNMG